MVLWRRPGPASAQGLLAQARAPSPGGDLAAALADLAWHLPAIPGPADAPISGNPRPNCSCGERGWAMAVDIDIAAMTPCIWIGLWRLNKLALPLLEQGHLLPGAGKQSLCHLASWLCSPVRISLSQGQEHHWKWAQRRRSELRTGRGGRRAPGLLYR